MVFEGASCTVRYAAAEKNCFMKVPKSWDVAVDKVSILEVTSDTSTIFVTCSGYSSSVYNSEASNVVELNGLFADKQGLRDGHTVFVRCLKNVVPNCRSVQIDPLSSDEWEILEQYAQYIQDNLLNQIRVVWSGARIPIWVTEKICTFVRVGPISPDTGECTLLQNLTEVLVCPRVRSQAQLKRPEERSQGADDRARSPLPAISAPPSITSPRSSLDLTASTAAAQYSSVVLPSLWSILVASVLPAKKVTAKKSPVSPDSSLQFSERSSAATLDDHFLNIELDLTLRVQVNNQESAIQRDMQRGRWHDRQASVCYVSIESLTGCSSCKEADVGRLKPCFLARLSKLNSPGELEEIYRSNRRRLREDTSATFVGTGGRPDNRSRQPGNAKPYEEADREVMLGVVRVIVLELAAACTQKTSTRCFEAIDADYQCWPAGGHVVLTRDFCTLHDVSATSRVRLTALPTSHVPSGIERLEFQATCSLPANLTSELMKIALGHYLDALRMDACPLVLNCEDRVRFPVMADKVAEFTVRATARGVAQPIKTEADRDGQLPMYFNIDRTCLDAAQFILDPITPWDKGCCEPYGIPKLSIESLGGFAHLFTECEVYLRQSFLMGSGHAGLLICGSKGCGKTSLAYSIMRQLFKHPCYCYAVEVDCKKLRGKRLDSLQQFLHGFIGEAIWRQPSVVLLDDIHAIARAALGPEEEMSGEVIYSTRVAEVLRDQLKKLTSEGHRVSVVATCISKGGVQQRLFATSGIHFFQKTVEIQQPDKEQRTAMLRSLLAAKGTGWESVAEDSLALDLAAVAQRTDGFYPADLASVVDRALLAQQMKQHKGRLKLNIDHFMAALVGFTPSCLRDVALHVASDVTWSDVGGLANVKRTLVQMLEWPKKYPSLFAQCPIRLQSGILLFGPPGTGKTLLASAIAKETGLNFISIKGPELLSKYIGASEQAVRTTFARAQSAKPCILFFDEFDSFAPKRGHDSTGVTDRVVNQLLTHLDGLEALTGVYVLAASSRPDLIDPALLRPGRLDKSLYCPMPDESERYEILCALSRKLLLSPDVDLKEIADKCKFFTGADLKSLLGSAQLAAAHEFLDEQRRTRSQSLTTPGTAFSRTSTDLSEQAIEGAVGEVAVEGVYTLSLDEEWQSLSALQDPSMMSELSTYVKWMTSARRERSQVMRDPLCVVVCQAHLLAAAAETQPSVSAADRHHYDQVYKNFQLTKESQFASLRPEQAKQKITLA